MSPIVTRLEEAHVGIGKLSPTRYAWIFLGLCLLFTVLDILFDLLFDGKINHDHPLTPLMAAMAALSYAVCDIRSDIQKLAALRAREGEGNG